MDSQRRTLVVAVAAPFLVLTVYCVPMGTVAHTARTLHAGVGAQAWILSGMSVGLAAALLIAGAIADSRGRRAVFVTGALVLLAGSMLAALASESVSFVCGRVLQGMGGAALTACSLGLLGHAFPEPAARHHATGLWGASVGAGIAAGPLLAAGLDAVSGWRASYWVTAIAALGLALAAARGLEESRAAVPRPIDPVGASLLALGLPALLGGLVEGRSGWSRPLTLGLLGSGLALLVAFVASQRRAGAMLDLTLFRRADFVAATASAFATGLGVIALMSFVPSVVARGLGGSLLTAACVLLGWSAVSVVAALGARRLPAAITGRHRLITGLVGVALGQSGLFGLRVDSSPWRLVPGLVVAGIASGVLNAALAREAIASVPATSAAMGSGANNTARYVGAAIGVTLVVMLAGRADPAAVIAGWNLAVPVTVAFSLVGALAAFFCRGSTTAG